MRFPFRRHVAAASLLVAVLAIPAVSAATTAQPLAVGTPDPQASADAVVGSGSDARSLDRLYRAYFLRDPDAGGYAYWQRALSAGRSLAAVSEDFARSSEFQMRYGRLSNADFVTLVYHNVLGRAPDPMGHSTWTTALDRGRTRGAVMIGFADSEEYKRRTEMYAAGSDSRSVDRLYLAYFLRTPDSEGLAHWKEQRTRGASLAAISDAFANSTEFRNRYGSLSNGGFVDLVYRNVLGRGPDAGGFAHWIEVLSRGGSRGAVMLGFSDSQEFKGKAGAVTPDPPPPPAGQSTVRPPDAPSNSYAFIRKDDAGQPVRWPVCESVGVVVNYAGAPPGARSALEESIDKIKAATKVDWFLEGETTERAPTKDWSRPFEDVVRYGDRYSPVLVSWAKIWPETNAVGVGGFASLRGRDGTSSIVTGQVTLDPDFVPRNRTLLVNLLLHELAHVANLSHSELDDQVMYASLRGYDSYQYGDRAGLAKVGGWDAECDRASASAYADDFERPAPDWSLVE